MTCCMHQPSHHSLSPTGWLRRTPPPPTSIDRAPGTCRRAREGAMPCSSTGSGSRRRTKGSWTAPGHRGPAAGTGGRSGGRPLRTGCRGWQGAAGARGAQRGGPLRPVQCRKRRWRKVGRRVWMAWVPMGTWPVLSTARQNEGGLLFLVCTPAATLSLIVNGLNALMNSSLLLSRCVQHPCCRTSTY